MTLALRVASRVVAGQIRPVERGSVLSENHVELAVRRGPPHRLPSRSFEPALEEASHWMKSVQGGFYGLRRPRPPGLFPSKLDSLRKLPQE